MLRENHSLHRLSLEESCIGPIGCHSLSLALRVNHQLRFLDLTGNEIGSDGFVIRAASPHALASFSRVLTGSQGRVSLSELA